MFPVARSSRIRRALLLATGQITQYGGMADDGLYEVGEPHHYILLTSGQYSGTVNITLNGKTDIKSNNCVMDDSTGLMWSRTASLIVGPTSSGALPWTTNGSGEGIFSYMSAANAANLAGYSDWRIPNVYELFCNTELEATDSRPNVSFFSWPASVLYSSTTVPSTIANALTVNFNSAQIVSTVKTNTAFTTLVRGPV